MDGRRACAVLGVSEHATPEDLRSAFRARALATHPDRGGSRTEFELVVLAFETLRHTPDVPAGLRRTAAARAAAARGTAERPARDASDASDAIRVEPAVTTRFSAYDTPGPRMRPVRRFEDSLTAAMLRVARDVA